MGRDLARNLVFISYIQNINGTQIKYLEHFCKRRSISRVPYVTQIMSSNFFCTLPLGCRQAICNRRWREASCHLVATNILHRIFLRRDTSLGAKVGQVFKCLKCQW